MSFLGYSWGWRSGGASEFVTMRHCFVINLKLYFYAVHISNRCSVLERANVSVLYLTTWLNGNVTKVKIICHLSISCGWSLYYWGSQFVINVGNWLIEKCDVTENQSNCKRVFLKFSHLILLMLILIITLFVSAYNYKRFSPPDVELTLSVLHQKFMSYINFPAN